MSKNLREINGAEEGTRTPMGLLPLDPEPSVSTSSTTSALEKLEEKWYVFSLMLLTIIDFFFCQFNN